MLGDPLSFANRGIGPRAISAIFSEIALRPELDVSVAVSYCEVYNEHVGDLLEKSRYAASMKPAGSAVSSTTPDYSIYDDPVEGVVVRGLSIVPVDTEEQALAALFSGETVRVTAAHSLNKASNRSHCIFTVHIKQRARLGAGRERITVSKLHLVDLAGSERLKKTILDGSGDMDSKLARESMHINRSLTYLEQCVVALSRASAAAVAASSGAEVKPVHVPYRQSKLTSILKDGLGGNCTTIFIGCVWCEERHLEETTSTLRLAARMMTVTNNVTRSAVAFDTTELLKKYEKTIEQLQQELAMHDALTDRTGVNYGDYSPEEQTTMNAKLKAYIEAQPGDESANISIESVAQVREILRQVKVMVKTASIEAEEKLRQKYTLVPKDTTPAASRPMSPDATHSTSLEHGSTAAAGVGVLDASSGLSLGIAAPSSRPPALSPGGLLGSSGNSAALGAALNSTTPMGSPQRATTPNSSSPARDANVAWKRFRESSTGAGPSLVARITALRKELAVHRDAATAAAKAVNVAKERLDALSVQTRTATSEEQRIALARQVSETKAAYRSAHAVLQEERRLFQEAEAGVDAASVELVKAFEAWHLSATGDSLRPTALSGQFAGFNTDGGKEDELDEAEAFERLERDRVASVDPDSLAFFTATKRLRQGSRLDKPTKFK
jgi:kinesin family protein 6/9